METPNLNIKIPIDIGKHTELLCRAVNNQYMFFLKNTKTGLSSWFCVDNLNEKEITRKIMKALITIESGYLNGFTLKGVGYKASTSEGMLNLRVGKSNSIDFKIPSNMYVWVTGTKVNGWSPDLSIMNNFFFKVIKKTPAKKGSLILNEKK